MQDFLWEIFEIAVNLCESFIIYYFICSFLKHNFKTTKGKLIYFLGVVWGTVITTFVNSITLYDWWMIAVYIASYFAFSCCFLKGKIIVKLLAAVTAELAIIVASNTVTGILSIALNSSPNQLFTMRGAYRVLGVLMCQVLNLFLYSLILKFFNKTILGMKIKEWALLISVFVISVLSFTIIQIAINEAKLSEPTSLMLIIAEIGLLALNIICLYIMISLNKSNRASEELKLKEQQLMHDIQYAETVRGQYEEIRNMRHDIKQHLAVVSGLQSEGKYDEAQKYITQISNNISKIEMFMDVGNDFVNAILNSKLSTAKSKGIEVLCSFSGGINGIDEYDLCNLIGNMLDNAIEAAEKTNTHAVVEMSIVSDKYKLTLKVSNSILKSVLNDNPALETSKSHKAVHGFGTKSIKSIAEKYNGNADFYEDGLTFICRVQLCKETAIELVPQ